MGFESGFSSKKEERPKKRGSGIGYVAAFAASALAGPTVEVTRMKTSHTEAVSIDGQYGPAVITPEEKIELAEIEGYLSKDAREEIATVRAAFEAAKGPAGISAEEIENSFRLDEMNRQRIERMDPAHLALHDKFIREGRNPVTGALLSAENPEYVSEQEAGGAGEAESKIKAALDAAKS